MYGFPWNRLKVKGALTVLCERNWCLDERWCRNLAHCNLFYIWGGRGQMTLRVGPSVDLRAGVCLWMRPGGQYIARHDPEQPLCVHALHFKPSDDDGNEYLEDAHLPHEVWEVADVRLFSATMAAMVTWFRESRSGAASMQASLETERIISGMAGTLIHSLLRSRPSHSESTREPYRSLIEEHIDRIYASPASIVGVKELAREAHLSCDYYSRIFKSIAGEPPRSTIQKARHERACQLMKETSLSLSQIAEEVGYVDVFQFSKLFKQHKNVPPSVWRRRGRRL